jgi:cytochrome P450
MMQITLRIVAKTLFDADVESDVRTIGHAMDVAVNMFTRAMNPWGPLLNVLPLPSNFRFRRARALLLATVDRFIQDRRVNGTERRTDLLSILVRAREGEEKDELGRMKDEKRSASSVHPSAFILQPYSDAGMTDQQLRDESLTLFTAGHETTANALTFAWHLLSRNHAAEARLHAEVDAVLDGGRLPTAADLDRLPYARAVLAESMRLYPPAWAVAREAKEEVEVAGHRLPPRTIVLMSQWVTHRDPRWWPEPERFEPGRWLPDGATGDRPRYAYYPFGGGPRNCIGEAFAWYEAILVMATIARHWRLEAVDQQPPEVIPTITLRPRCGLQMIVRRR